MANNLFRVNRGLNLTPTTTPASPVNGDIYYDTATDTFQFFQGGSWVEVGGGAFTPVYAFPPGYNTITNTQNYNSLSGDSVSVRLSKLTCMIADKAQDKTVKYLANGITAVGNATSGSAQQVTFDGGATLTILQPGNSGNAVVTLPMISLLVNQSAYIQIDRNNPTTPSVTVVNTASVPLDENIFLVAERLSDTNVWLWDNTRIPLGGLPYGPSAIYVPPTPNYVLPGGYNTLAGTANYNTVQGEDLVTRASKLTGMMADKAQDKTIAYIPQNLTTIVNTTSGSAQQVTFDVGSTLTLVQPGSPGNAVVTLPYAAGSFSYTTPGTVNTRDVINLTSNSNGTSGNNFSPAFEYVPASNESVTQVSVIINNLTSSTPFPPPPGGITQGTGSISAHVYSDSAGVPGSLIATSTNSIAVTSIVGVSFGSPDFVNTVCNFTFTGVAMTSGTPYWIVFDGPTGGSNFTQGFQGISGGGQQTAANLNGGIWTPSSLSNGVYTSITGTLTPPTPISLLINQSAYVSIDRNNASTPTFTVANTTAVPVDENVFVIAERLGGTSVYLWNDLQYQVGSTSYIYSQNITATSNSTLTSLPNLTSAASLATIGTITSGTWNGTTIDVPHGGTGATSLTSQAILLGNGTSPVSVVTVPVNGGEILTGNTSTEVFQSGAFPNSSVGEITTSVHRFAMSYIPISNQGVKSISIVLSQGGGTNGNTTAKIYSNSSGPGSVLFSSSDTYLTSSLPTSNGIVTFHFSGTTLTSGTTYWISVESTTTAGTVTFWNYSPAPPPVNTQYLSYAASGSGTSYFFDTAWHTTSVGNFWTSIVTSNVTVSAPIWSATPVLGENSVATGSLGLAWGGGGGATVTVQNIGALAAYNFNLPLTVGTAGQVLTSQGGGTNWMTWTTPGALNVVSKTTTYSAVQSDNVILCSGSAFTVTLDSALFLPGQQIMIKKTDSSLSNIITIGCFGAQTIDGQSTTTLNTQYESITLVSQGTTTGWTILNRDIPRLLASYTPTFTAFGTVTSVNFHSWREGNCLVISGIFKAGTLTSAAPAFTMQFATQSVTTDSSIVPTSGVNGYLHLGTWNVNLTHNYFSSIVGFGNNSSVFFGIGSSTIGGGEQWTNATGAGSPTIASGDAVSIECRIPITGWNT